MSPFEIDAVLRYAAGLWPRGVLGDAENLAWARGLGQIEISVEQAKLAMDDVRLQRDGTRPPIAVINRRLRSIAESESRARIVNAPVPDASLDYSKPQGLVVEAIRLWREDPQHPRWAEWRQKAVAGKLLLVLRASWLRWAGTAGPYA